MPSKINTQKYFERRLFGRIIYFIFLISIFFNFSYFFSVIAYAQTNPLTVVEKSCGKFEEKLRVCSDYFDSNLEKRLGNQLVFRRLVLTCRSLVGGPGEDASNRKWRIDSDRIFCGDDPNGSDIRIQIMKNVAKKVYDDDTKVGSLVTKANAIDQRLKQSRVPVPKVDRAPSGEQAGIQFAK